LLVLPNRKTILETLLATLPEGWQIHRLHLGVNWTLAQVQGPDGELRAGLAASPPTEVVAGQSRFVIGDNAVGTEEAREVVGLALSPDMTAAALGLATLNALLQPDPALLSDIDAGDWLLEQGRGKKLAVVGSFPFVAELRPVVAQLWVLELQPKLGEYPASTAPEIIPQADILAITGSTLVNHTLDDLLKLARPETKVMVLGPTTPLSPVLFDYGVDLLSGVQVVDVAAVLVSIEQGVSFRKMQGVRRVTLEK